MTNYTKGVKKMEMREGKRYLRIENVVYVELAEGETPEDGEDRFMDALPEGIDIASFKSEIWIPEE